MQIKEYSIQELTEKTGLPRRTIHFYSQQGILPPPNGAGLGASYDDRHLVSLLLIPALRQQGLRLDDIRSRLAGMDLTALQSLFAQVGETSVGGADEPARPPVSLPSGQPFMHHLLPAGMTLVVPGTLNPAERKKVQELLDYARRLFSSQV